MACCNDGLPVALVVNVYSPVAVFAVNVTVSLLTPWRIPCDGSTLKRTTKDSEPSLSALRVNVTSKGTVPVSRTDNEVVATTCGLSATARTLIGCGKVLTLLV